MSRELPADWFEATPLALTAPVDPQDYDAMMAGILAEIELTRADLGDGVVTGFACTINGTSVDVGVGRAYCAGKRYSGGLPVSFAGLAAGTYTIYIDSADDDEPYKAAVATGYEIGEGEMALYQVDWDGATTLSDLFDVRPDWPYLVVGS